jgi:hypothetical protein
MYYQAYNSEQLTGSESYDSHGVSDICYEVFCHGIAGGFQLTFSENES